MKDFAIALAAVSFLVMAMGFFFKKVKRSFLSEPIIAMAAGMALGPEALRVLDMREWGPFETIMEAATQVTLSMALMATAFRIPKGYFLSHKGFQSALVFLGMLGMWAVSGLLIRFIFGFDWLLSFLIGAVITPTDPVVASTIVAGETAKKLLPDRVRRAISFESGANDGMALPLVFLPLLLMEKPGGHAWGEWLLKPVLWETLGGISLGLLIGFAAGKFLVKARNANWTSETALLSFALSLGFFTLGFLEFIGCNGIVGVFAAGWAANWALDQEEDIEQEKIQESLERVFTIPIFFLFGLVLPWKDWWALGWKAVWIVAAVLLLRRLPVVFALRPLLGRLPKKADLAMVGWFGPIGVAALYYAAHSLSRTGMMEVWVVGSLVVFGSTLIHGLTGYPFAKLYSRWERGSPEAASAAGGDA